MNERQQRIVDKKLVGMVDRLRRLQQYDSLTLDEYLSDEDIQDLVERRLEILIQSAIDINKAILQGRYGLDRENVRNLENAETFRLLGDYGFLDKEISEILSSSGGMRNVLAHMYDDIIHSKVYEALVKALQYYPQYIKTVRVYLDSLEAEENDED